MKSLSMARTLPLVAVFITVVSATFVAGWLIPYAEVLWDESVFLLWNWRIYYAIATGNIPALSAATFWQFDYPPLQSYAVGILLQPFQFTVINARLIHLIFFIGSSLFIYLLGNKVGKDILRTKPGAHATAALSLFFFAFSPIILYLSSVLLKELPATFMGLITIYFYIYARDRKKVILYVIPAVTLAGLFFTKYQYAIFYTLAFGIETIITLLTTKNRKLIIFAHVLLITPLATSFLIWVVWTNRFSYFLSRMLNNALDYSGGLADPITYILFYPKGIMYLYSFSPILGFSILITGIAGVVFRKHYSLRIGMIAFLVNVILLAQHTMNVQERYLVTTIPYFFISASCLIVKILNRVSRMNRIVKTSMYAVISGILILSVSDLFMLPSRIYAIGSIALKGMAFTQTDYNDTWFNYKRDTWSVRPPWQSHERSGDIAQFIAENVDPAVPFTFYGSINEIPPDYITLLLEQKMKTEYTSRGYSWYVATVELSPVSPLRTLDYKKIHEWKEFEIQNIKNNTALDILAKKEFPELGAVATIYGGK